MEKKRIINCKTLSYLCALHFLKGPISYAGFFSHGEPKETAANEHWLSTAHMQSATDMF